MTDSDKVIKGLEMSYTYSNVDEGNTLVPQQLVLDALALLKAQEPVAAIPVEWLRNLCAIAKMETDDEIFIGWLIQTWQEEQEAR